MDIELKIEKLVFGGDGLGFVDGKACFVEGALPGEKIHARILNDKANFMKAKLIHILEASPLRITHPNRQTMSPAIITSCKCIDLFLRSNGQKPPVTQ